MSSGNYAVESQPREFKRKYLRRVDGHDVRAMFLGIFQRGIDGNSLGRHRLNRRSKGELVHHGRNAADRLPGMTTLPSSEFVPNNISFVI